VETIDLARLPRLRKLASQQYWPFPASCSRPLLTRSAESSKSELSASANVEEFEASLQRATDDTRCYQMLPDVTLLAENLQVGRVQSFLRLLDYIDKFQ
jgi:hypothetical protein